MRNHQQAGINKRIDSGSSLCFFLFDFFVEPHRHKLSEGDAFFYERFVWPWKDQRGQCAGIRVAVVGDWPETLLPVQEGFQPFRASLCREKPPMQRLLS